MRIFAIESPKPINTSNNVTKTMTATNTKGTSLNRDGCDNR